MKTIIIIILMVLLSNQIYAMKPFFDESTDTNSLAKFSVSEGGHESNLLLKKENGFVVFIIQSRNKLTNDVLDEVEMKIDRKGVEMIKKLFNMFKTYQNKSMVKVPRKTQ